MVWQKKAVATDAGKPVTIRMTTRAVEVYNGGWDKTLATPTGMTEKVQPAVASTVDGRPASRCSPRRA